MIGRNFNVKNSVNVYERNAKIVQKFQFITEKSYKNEKVLLSLTSMTCLLKTKIHQRRTDFDMVLNEFTLI